jgi:hypothetical protein
MSTSRRDFLRLTACGAAGSAVLKLPRLDRLAVEAAASDANRFDLVVAGAGLGGVAAALAATRAGLRVALTEETDWIGGQLTQQAVPPDEHQWIETHGATRSYRDLRTGIRDYYRRYYPLTDEARARAELNPGDGAVSRLCHEPRVALAVLEGLLAPHIATGRLTLLLEHAATAADVEGNRVRSLSVRNLRTGAVRDLEAPIFVDATELGDLLPLTGTEFVTGCEGRRATGELHMPDKADGANQQAFTAVFVMDFVPGSDQTIEKPRDYAFWRDHVPRLTPPWPGRLLALASSHPVTLAPRQYAFDPVGDQKSELFNLWRYRRIANRANFLPGTYAGDLSTVNWPQNDYMLGNLVGVSGEERHRHVDAAKQLSLSLLYWLQTEAPRPDGKAGWHELRLRGDIAGSGDGLAKYPYVRESRRIRAVTTVLEQHCGTEARAAETGRPAAKVAALEYPDSVGIGSYRIDLHPTSAGDNYVDFASLPFQIPLGALLPVRTENVLAACKNIGTTHVTNGCYRLHPVEWNIGEAAGALAAFAAARGVRLHAVRDTPALLADFQRRLVDQGVELRWPPGTYPP